MTNPPNSSHPTSLEAQAEKSEKGRPFTCFNCGDGLTPLYCLNCASEILKNEASDNNKCYGMAKKCKSDGCYYWIFDEIKEKQLKRNQELEKQIEAIKLEKDELNVKIGFQEEYEKRMEAQIEALKAEVEELKARIHTVAHSTMEQQIEQLTAELERAKNQIEAGETVMRAASKFKATNDPADGKAWCDALTEYDKFRNPIDR